MVEQGNHPVTATPHQRRWKSVEPREMLLGADRLPTQSDDRRVDARNAALEDLSDTVPRIASDLVVVGTALLSLDRNLPRRTVLRSRMPFGKAGAAAEEFLAQSPRRIFAHLTAGADHVAIQVLGEADPVGPLAEIVKAALWRRLRRRNHTAPQ